MIYLDLLLGFLKVGCFAFGGAYGAIPLIRDVVMSYGWLSEEMLTYMIAVSESTPGPIMVNLATYIGSNQAGFLGAAIATLAVVLPSFLIILLVTALLKTALKNNKDFPFPELFDDYISTLVKIRKSQIPYDGKVPRSNSSLLKEIQEKQEKALEEIHKKNLDNKGNSKKKK